jgi:hypothetical protein
LTIALRTRWGQATAGLRPLPDFLVIGAQKAGTGSLYRHLAAHPQVIRASRKEVHYFDLNHHRGPDWYRAHFPVAPGRLLGLGGRRVGEGTPYYLFHPHVPRRVAALLPDVRLLVLLRDPVERAFSHHQWERRYGRETLAFEEALAAEELRTAPEMRRLAADPDFYAPHHHRHAYRARGRYAEQLERWFEWFPRERFFIEASERFFADPACVFRRVVAFLGLPPWLPASFERFNPGRYEGALRPETRAALRAEFRPHDERLYALLGVDYGWGEASASGSSASAPGASAP